MKVWVYPERTWEQLGAERYQVSWEEVKTSAKRRNRMLEMNAKRKHAKAGHIGEFDNCTVRECEMARLVEIDPDSDIEYLYANFSGADAKEKALGYARKKVNAVKTAYGAATVTRQVVGWHVEEDRIAEWQNTAEEEHID